MAIRNFALLALTGVILAGCFESEESCYERLMDDFDRSRTFANTTCRNYGTRESCSDYELAALNSQSRIYLIYMDDDQNACDYISDGPYLARKR
jgi:hypothetical protein